ncbi:tumor necrosis factor receptor superfamily member wengen isoform X2 [Orussus abietinus]|uniref:tumor necrosis factor receptor superfamily member wengen isoform X2 n=1 Tax=Orussus abietinus TaxID=222816 RepID=UPI00062695F7|nr:tumor necrosis factor receptor superfamily member wengen isoform X2 [Orussus abietinus]
MPKEACTGLLIVTLVLVGSLSRLVWTRRTSPGSPGSSGRQPICRAGLEFWSAERLGCVPCTICAPDVTVSPCAIHKDATCGPLSALELDWSFLSRGRKKESEAPLDSRVLWPFPGDREQRPGPLDDVLLELASGGESTGKLGDEYEERWIEDVLERRSDREETGTYWDLQTGTLILAVCACILFFTVVGLSALVYARQWRRMKKNFQPGLEEIFATLNSMVKAELAELPSEDPTSAHDPENGYQCLEKLLDRKPATLGWREDGGNLYIEEGNNSASRHLDIVQVHRNVERTSNDM